MTMRQQRGFSLIELLVSTSLTICVAAALFAAIHPAESVFNVQSEAADMQQRLRVATSVLFKDLSMAGAGIDAGPGAGSLIDSVPPILPYRQALVGGDPPGTFRDDAITVMHVPSRAQTTIADVMPARSGSVRVNIGFGCPMSDAACGLGSASTVLVLGRYGVFDRFRIERVDGSLLDLQHTIDDSAQIHPAGSRIVEAEVHSYFLRTDIVTGHSQLVREDGDGRAAVPVVDHVVGLRFEYFGDPRPPEAPRPPDVAEQPTSYPPGESCLVARGPLSEPLPRLSPLPPENGGGLIALTAASLTDGPWCPDQSTANRYDADLLRVRRVAVTLRVESAADALRGPAGALFSRAGTSTSGNLWLPDLNLRFQVSPRNLLTPFTTGIAR
jgi:hypothetical protein